MPDKFPAKVNKLAELSKGNPIAFHEYEDGRLVIVMEDGRKLTFTSQQQAEMLKPAPLPKVEKPKPETPKKPKP